MVLSHNQNIPLYHTCDTSCWTRWGQTLYHKILVDYCKKGPPPKDAEILITEPYFTIPDKCRASIHTDIPYAIDHYGLKKVWFKYFESQAHKAKWQLRWSQNNAIVIHVRLDDKRPYDPNQSHPTGEGRGQGYIGDKRLKELIHKLHERFPEKSIYLITSPHAQDISRCQSVVMEFNYVKGVFGDTDFDYSLWQMMCCDILILSKSTFSMLAGFLHQGSHCFTYEDWAGIDCFLGKDNTHKWENLPLNLGETK